MVSSHTNDEDKKYVGYLSQTMLLSVQWYVLDVTPPKTNMLHPKMEVWFRWVCFSTVVILRFSFPSVFPKEKPRWRSSGKKNNLWHESWNPAWLRCRDPLNLMASEVTVLDAPAIEIYRVWWYWRVGDTLRTARHLTMSWVYPVVHGITTT